MFDTWRTSISWPCPAKRRHIDVCALVHIVNLHVSGRGESLQTLKARVERLGYRPFDWEEVRLVPPAGSCLSIVQYDSGAVGARSRTDIAVTQLVQRGSADELYDTIKDLMDSNKRLRSHNSELQLKCDVLEQRVVPIRKTSRRTGASGT